MSSTGNTKYDIPAPGYYNYRQSLNTSSLTSFLTREPDWHWRFELEVQNYVVAHNLGLVVGKMTADTDDSMSMIEIPQMKAV